MKKRRESYDPVPHDGQVRLRPGSWVSFHNDTETKPNIGELQEQMRLLRGFVLADAFAVENSLILVELAAEFGTDGASSDVPASVEKEISLRSEHSFGSKIERVKPIIRAQLAKPTADRLVQNLANCRELRNLVAHYPCWMEAINDEERQRTVSLELFIGDRKHIWKIDREEADAWAKEFLAAKRGLTETHFAILGRDPPIFIEGSFVLAAPREVTR